jgi:hypothetical protein
VWHASSVVARLKFVVVAGVLAAVAFARPVHAQMPLDGSSYAFPVPDYVGSLVGANSLDPTLTRSGRKGEKESRKRPHRPKAPTRKQRATLRFKPSSKVTQGVYQRVLDRLGAGVDPALVTQQLDAAKTNFRAVLKRVGWSSRDLGDIAAFSLVQGYITWHEVERVSPSGLKRLRRDVRENLARQRAVRRLADARQQEIAEILELRVIFFLDQRNDAQRAGDTAAVSAARADMRDWAQSIFGVDLNVVRLTSRGLVKR